MPEEKQDKLGKNPFEGRKYVRGVGRRKSSSATVQLYAKGTGKFLINKLELKDYFARPDLIEIAKASLEKLGKLDSTDINARAAGGGKKGQAESVRLAIARALISHDADLKPQLRAAGFVTVDRRVKERKKPGLKRARRAPQWSKR
ncbi:MAG: 30S ribosomal protein S9 [Parcubacteria group bacterium CG1_02_41_12]|nr:MAG: 30S ribosomal protein S9 [Parcubacteria group bacterium CG1_02_41_12]PIP67176.1 MAG: 30S ribosomal protein S9 [Parcubacteria group bacterium CG22_combo_CG10-13_8_21_14_all_41_9]PIQ78957.1 MAG: 30S ribosomal protein S9 [Parcubacteria group bacterium CG11_big_fil_rev_8_21_14_0_20_41_14]PIR57385.1 MAG: 30S ribosomal protein S9 [Parcubacteria group bacterium CG10_big_fil_rev_8_21_14_0_10_41_35]PIZ81304.1 MAG: 30S ribosomal protein S9 [Parcubacteria group bacterium CG_4_10_14_0_2_um_filter_4